MSTPDRPRRATALRYSGEGSPEVVAAGAGELADRILARAREAGVPVREDPALAEALASLAVGTEVPEELWTAVARVLVWAYEVEDRLGPGRMPEGRVTPKG
jgi:flagellar biosynthesis protein